MPPTAGHDARAAAARLPAPAAPADNLVPGGPTAARLQLGAELRRLRAEARLDGQDAAAAIGSSASKISRIEGGQSPVSRADVTGLLVRYGVRDKSQRARLLGLADKTQQRGWWDPLSDVLPGSVRYQLSLEAEASRIMIYEPMAVPALLQTPAYAHAVSWAGLDGPRCRGGLSLSVQARRREILGTSSPPFVWALIHAAALARAPGGDRAILRDQLLALREAADAPGITVQIIPDDDEHTLIAPGPFALLRFAQPDVSQVVLTETLTGLRVSSRPQDIDRHQETFDTLAQWAQQPAVSAALLATLAQRAAAAAPPARPRLARCQGHGALPRAGSPTLPACMTTCSAARTTRPSTRPPPSP